MGEILHFFENITPVLEEFLNSIGIWGGVVAAGCMTVESILPCMPLCIFISLEFYLFGPLIGFVISWIFTSIGCIFSFLLFRHVIKGFIEKRLKKDKKKKIDELMVKLGNINLPNFVLLVAMPFTPAFVVNIAAGLSTMSLKKFATGIFIGKIFMVYFWGYVGTNLVESIAHPINLVKIMAMLLVAFVLSKLINKCVDVK